jgi:hypothetical protein
LTLAPNQGFAQEKKNEKATEKRPAGTNGVAQKAKAPYPFRGEVVAVDKAAKTVKVDKRVLQVTATTRIQKHGKPATLDDAVVGEPVRGSIRESEDGKLNLVSISFGQRVVEGEKAPGEKPAQPQSVKPQPKEAQKAEQRIAE